MRARLLLVAVGSASFACSDRVFQHRATEEGAPGIDATRPIPPLDTVTRLAGLERSKLGIPESGAVLRVSHQRSGLATRITARPAWSCFARGSMLSTTAASSFVSNAVKSDGRASISSLACSRKRV
jgi:hypothetical protein